MFKHYLTHSFVQNFHRACIAFEIGPTATRDRLNRSAALLWTHFDRSLRASDRKEIAKDLCVALICLRDCREILDESSLKDPEIERLYPVVHGRIEKLLEEAADLAERGQLRMII